MLEGLIAWVLNTYLGEYVENLNTDQLSVGIFQGNVELENLPLKKSALKNLGFPFVVKSGLIGRIKLQIPVRRLKSEQWVVTIEDLFLIAGPDTNDVYNSEAEEKLFAEKKKILLAEFDENFKLQKDYIQQSASSSSSSSSWLSWWSYGTSFITNIIDNFQLQVKNVHIRYEDDVSIPYHTFACGVTINSISAQSADSNWPHPILYCPLPPCKLPGFNYRGLDSILHKIVDLNEFAFYWDCRAQLFEQMETVDKNSFIEFFKKQNEFMQSDACAYVLEPVSCFTKFQRGTSSLPLRSRHTPRIWLDVTLDNLPVSLHEGQFRQMHTAMKAYDMVCKANKYRKFKPLTQDGTNWKKSEVLWKFALNVTMNEVKERNKRFKKEFMLKRARTNVLYVKAYRSWLTLGPKYVVKIDKDFMDEFEAETALEELRILRSIVTEELLDCPCKNQAQSGTIEFNDNNNFYYTVIFSTCDTIFTTYFVTNNCATTASFVTTCCYSTGHNICSPAHTFFYTCSINNHICCNIDTNINNVINNNAINNCFSNLTNSYFNDITAKRSTTSITCCTTGYFAKMKALQVGIPLSDPSTAPVASKEQPDSLDDLDGAQQASIEDNDSNNSNGKPGQQCLNTSAPNHLLKSEFDEDLQMMFDARETENSLMLMDVVFLRVNFKLNSGSLNLKSIKKDVDADEHGVDYINIGSTDIDKADDAQTTICEDSLPTGQPLNETILLKPTFNSRKGRKHVLSDLLLLECKEIEMKFESRTRVDGWMFGIEMSNLTLHDQHTTDSIRPTLISSFSEKIINSRRSHDDENRNNSEIKKLFKFCLEKNPFFTKASYKLSISSQPLDIVYNPTFIEKIKETLTLPQDPANFQLDITALAKRKYEVFKKQTKRELQQTIDAVLEGNVQSNSTSWLLDVDMFAPHIILPRNFTDPHATIVIFDLGHMLISNKKKQETPAAAVATAPHADFIANTDHLNGMCTFLRS
ncbi:hypothetical protein HELRODRAFT_187936 [Helobdella robusta]|uniref:Chorein N-terminal domain-containing protein n=1 Tax=Helobdella robusta TaxID=6412 RepID=T1FPH5_HELRO|nr:hypothetical protein HELRODRAFT_187936 [Helobdella robusta]ESO12638.1 hypothetical protein HELRODRAFT_187936 [Helobdella robusta]